jgi:hypothetical protein
MNTNAIEQTMTNDLPAPNTARNATGSPVPEDFRRA